MKSSGRVATTLWAKMVHEVKHKFRRTLNKTLQISLEKKKYHLFLQETHLLKQIILKIHMEPSRQACNILWRHLVDNKSKVSQVTKKLGS